MFKNILRIAVQEAFPPHTRGRPALLGFDDAYDDILRVVRTGMQWRYLRPTAAVAYITVFKTMHKWIDAGLFHTAYARLLRLYRRHRRPRYSCVDSTFVKNVYGVDCVGRNPTDRGRMATKLSAAVDDEGVPYSLLCTPGNQSDMRLLQPTLAAAIVPTPTETPLYGERTTLHPIGVKYAMRINLLFRTSDVEIFNLHGDRMEHNHRFDTFIIGLRRLTAGLVPSKSLAKVNGYASRCSKGRTIFDADVAAASGWETRRGRHGYTSSVEPPRVS